MLALVLAAAVATAPVHWVEDHAGFLTPSVRTELDQRLAGYESATGHQVIVWIGDTTGGEPLDDWAVRNFAAWKVGRKGHDDGVVMFVLAQDRAIDIEVGYGLEDRLTDARASRIIREVMTPKLQAGDRDGAVRDGVDAILATIEGKPWQGRGAAPAPAVARPETWKLILGGLAAIAFLIFAITHPRTALLLLWSIGRGGLGGFGGGGGGGGFSGGGGRSGGGGARGSW